MDIINIIFQYIPLDYILLIGGLVVIGEMLKRFTTLPNTMLTTALPVVGALVMGLININETEVFATSEFIKQVSIGLLMGWAATGGFEWFKNTFNRVSNLKVIEYVQPIETDPALLGFVEENEKSE